jgi:hypothetical protein
MHDDSVLSGRFDDFANMSAQAQTFADDTDCRAIYYTLNPIAPERAKYVGAYRSNQLKVGVRGTRDRDIEHRNLYLVDVDPVRPSGVCATDAEKTAAKEVMEKVQAHLAGNGFPEPLILDSGNGNGLLYKGAGPTHDGSWSFLLKHLAKTFNTDAAKVDTSVGAIRIPAPRPSTTDHIP